MIFTTMDIFEMQIKLTLVINYKQGIFKYIVMIAQHKIHSHN